MKIKRGLGVIVVLCLVVLMGCSEQKGESDQGPEALVLKSYRVPDRLAKEIHESFISILYPKIGRVNLAPDGQLLIAAPKSFHDGIEDFIKQMIINNPEPSPSVEVHYWIVVGRKAKNPAKLDEFNGIKPALETIQNSQGNMEFKLLDRISATSLSQGTLTILQGAFVSIEQRVSAFNDGSLVIHPKIKTISSKGSIETQIETRNNELVVLGQLSQEFYGPRPIFEAKEKGKTTYVELVNVYYIISATVKK